jgi:hypothetical protein
VNLAAVRRSDEGNPCTPLPEIETKSSNSESITFAKLRESEIFSIIF